MYVKNILYSRINPPAYQNKKSAHDPNRLSWEDGRILVEKFLMEHYAKITKK